jgi:transcriptional regulator with XRE-family HTH domain
MVDWKLIIAEIQRHGYSQPQIAAACGCAQATVSDLASGVTKDPRHSLGKKLETLLATCQERDQAGEKPLSAGGPQLITELALVDRRERALPIPFEDRRTPAGEGS